MLKYLTTVIILKYKYGKTRGDIMENQEIFDSRKRKYDMIKGARVGDYLQYKDVLVRFSYDHGESLQTSEGGSFYLGKGYLSYSGGLNSGIDRDKLEDTGVTKKGVVWFFDKDIWGAGRGVNFEMEFRVFKIKDEHLNDINPDDIIGSQPCPNCGSADVYKGITHFNLHCNKCKYVEPVYMLYHSNVNKGMFFSYNDAWKRLQELQPNSNEHAIKHEGWLIKKVN